MRKKSANNINEEIKEIEGHLASMYLQHITTEMWFFFFRMNINIYYICCNRKVKSAASLVFFVYTYI